MIPKINKKIFVSLFVHWDLITKTFPKAVPIRPKKETLDSLEEINWILQQKGDLEFPITQKLFNALKSVPGELRIGGNAGNASVSLGELGISSILSSPIRPASLMKKLSEYPIKVIADGKEVRPFQSIRSDPEFTHIILEQRNCRKIFTYDLMVKELWLDYDFWNPPKDPDLLFLSGFHLVESNWKEKVKFIRDILENRKYKTHLELAYGRKNTKSIIHELLSYHCVDSLGLNQDELWILGHESRDTEEIKSFCLEFLKDFSLQRLCLHSKNYRMVFFKNDFKKNFNASKLSVEICAAKTFGKISEKTLEMARKLKFSGVKTEKGKNYFLLPTLKNPNPELVTGLGDTAGITEFVFSMS